MGKPCVGPWDLVGSLSRRQTGYSLGITKGCQVSAKDSNGEGLQRYSTRGEVWEQLMSIWKCTGHCPPMRETTRRQDISLWRDSYGKPRILWDGFANSSIGPPAVIVQEVCIQYVTVVKWFERVFWTSWMSWGEVQNPTLKTFGIIDHSGKVLGLVLMTYIRVWNFQEIGGKVDSGRVRNHKGTFWVPFFVRYNKTLTMCDL